MPLPFGADDREPVAPGELEVERAEPERRRARPPLRRAERRRRRCASRRELEPKLPRLVRLVDRLEPVELLADTPSSRPSSSSSCDPARSRAPPTAASAAPAPRARLLLGAVALPPLVVAHAPARALGLVLAPAAGELRRAVRPFVELDDARDRAVEELTVVRHDDDRAGEDAATNRSSRSSPAKSRSFVGSSRRRTSKRARRIAASCARAASPPDSARAARRAGARDRAPRRRAGHEPRDRRRRARGTRRARRVTSARAPAPQRVARRGRPSAQRPRQRRSAGRGRRRATRRARRPLLRQIADGELRRRPRGPFPVGLVEPGEDAQERRLPGAVRTDEADAAAGGTTSVTSLRTSWAA